MVCRVLPFCPLPTRRSGLHPGAPADSGVARTTRSWWNGRQRWPWSGVLHPVRKLLYDRNYLEVCVFGFCCLQTNTAYSSPQVQKFAADSTPALGSSSHHSTDVVSADNLTTAGEHCYCCKRFLHTVWKLKKEHYKVAYNILKCR